LKTKNEKSTIKLQRDSRNGIWVKRSIMSVPEVTEPEMKIASSVLVLPGWHDSGLRHWQTLWEQEEPSFRRVQQKDWETPQLSDWIEGISREVGRAAPTVVFAAHSLGCIALLHWTQTASPVLVSRVKGALLAAPADVDRPECPEPIKNFAPVPRGMLPLASVVAASSDDPPTFPSPARANSPASGEAASLTSDLRTTSRRIWVTGLKESGCCETCYTEAAMRLPLPPRLRPAVW